MRDLHDGAQQRLVHTILALKLAQRAFGADSERSKSLVVGTTMIDIVEATVPGYVRPDLCDDIRNSPFDDSRRGRLTAEERQSKSSGSSTDTTVP